MKELSDLRKAVRSALMIGAAASMGLTSFAVAAQQSAEPGTTGQSAAATNAEAMGTVTVTGSRIKRTSSATAQPVLRISHQEIQASGLQNMGQLLHQMTSSGAGLNPTYNASFNRHGDEGASQLDMRHLGSQRVLVLLNGRRFNTGLGGSVNLNLIPVSIIDHIEVLKDGASAIYGSDAISGVVNIITRQNFNGAEASAYYGEFVKDGNRDGAVQQYNFSLGATTNKSSIFFNIGYVQQDPIWAGDREFSQEPLHYTGVTRGSSNTPQGRFRFYVPPSFTVDPSSPSNAADPSQFPKAIPSSAVGYLNQICPIQQVGEGEYLPHCDLTIKNDTDGQSITDYRQFKPEDHYNFAPDNYILDPSQHTNAFIQGHYDLSDNVTFHSSMLYTHSLSKQVLAAQTLGISPPAKGGGGIVIPPRPQYPYNPFGFSLNASGGPNSNFVGYNRRTLESGNRIYTENRNIYRFDGGFSGNFLTGTTLWDWDADYVYARTSQYTLFTGSYDFNRVQNAVSGCLSTADTDCVPMNLFGGQGPNGEGTITPTMIKYTSYAYQTHISSNQRIYSANIATSNLAALPAGGLGLAVGTQYRAQDGHFQPDAAVVHGNPPVPPTDGRYSVTAYYAELNVPLIANVAGAYKLGLDVAARRDDYSTFGVANTARAGLKWQPVQDLLIRGTWSEGFRAPSIKNLFAGAFGQGIAVDDPCSDWSASPDATVRQRCQADGVPKSYVQQQFQINNRAGGNPNLQPETSVSKTVGFVYSPSFLPGFDANFDYYKIEIDNAITQLGGQTILSFCYQAGVFCDRITRSPFSHGLAQIENSPVNSGGILTEGIDGGISYQFPVTAFGAFEASIQTNYIMRFVNIQESPSGGTQAVDLTDADSALPAGEFTSYPQYKTNLNLRWVYGNWAANLTGHYISHFTEICSDYLNGTNLSLTSLGLCSYPNHDDNSKSRNNVGGVTWWDAQVAYNINGLNTQVAFGIRNVFDRPPPRAVTVVRNSLFYNSQLYGISFMGRFPYLRVTTRF